MVQHLYKSFLTDEAEYKGAEARWRQLWDRIIATVKPVAEWTVPWFPPEFVNGTPMRDGNPIFSAVCPALRQGVRISQHEPTTDEVELEYWQDTFEGDEPIAELVISCALSDQVEEQVERLVIIWIERGDVPGSLGIPTRRDRKQ
jgi:hypothetical protein